ncbi:Dabb family protein [Lentisphaera profundi]|uniref:Dabb family protein n=1 Tax=Lentisphaera profundi TaxID=1658616 RepID=A0ABY7VNR9_9BACT|nr:Dabb family protein [Lentisphaera profundi]WDE95416.1 Dabb family protein [Lentisphaera profundi]
MINHGVVFTLKKDSALSREEFFAEALKLKKINPVIKFKIVRETSSKNTFEFGLFMKFQNPEAYALYNNHPDHLHFIQNIWIPNIEDFMEIDFEKIL